MEIWIPVIGAGLTGVLGAIVAIVRACQNRSMVLKALDELRGAQVVEIKLTDRGGSIFRVRANRGQEPADRAPDGYNG